MRRIMISYFLIFLLCSSGKAQLPYEPLSSFGKDTTAFVLYNFMDRADYYKGKTLKEVAQDLQIPIKHINESFGKRGSTFNGIDIYIYDGDKQFNIFDDKTVGFYCIYMYWEDENLSGNHIEAIRRTPNNLNLKYDSYKDYKIKEIGVSLPHDSKYKAKYSPKKTKSANPKEQKTIENGRMIYRYRHSSPHIRK